jgi:hypothetical protein
MPANVDDAATGESLTIYEMAVVSERIVLIAWSCSKSSAPDFPVVENVGWGFTRSSTGRWSRHVVFW